MFGSGGKSSSPGPAKMGTQYAGGHRHLIFLHKFSTARGILTLGAFSIQQLAEVHDASVNPLALALDSMEGRKEGREGGREEGKRCHADDGHQTRSFATVPPQQTDGWSGPGQLQSCSEVSARTGRQHRMWKLRMLKLRRPLSLALC